MRKIIGIISTSILNSTDYEHVNRIYTNKAYIDSVVQNGGTPIILPVTDNEQSIKDMVTTCDSFLFMGGADIDPYFYGEEPIEQLGSIFHDVDMFQLKLMSLALESKKPILGICRGCQLLNVATGGTLHQHIPILGDNILKHSQDTLRSKATHFINIIENTLLYDIFSCTKLRVNSFHHQSIKELGKGIDICAKSSDGIIEAISIKDHPFAVGVQWHPEEMIYEHKEMSLLFSKFIKA